MPDFNIERLGSGDGGGIEECDLVILQSDTVGTVSRNHNGRMEVGIWRLEASGSVTLLGSEEDDSVAGVSACTADNEMIIAGAYRTADLRLAAWSWIGTQVQGNSTGGKTDHATSIACFSQIFGLPLTNVPDPPPGTILVAPKGFLAVTACANETFELLVTAWMAFSGQPPFHGTTRLASLKAGSATVAAIAGIATRNDTNGNLNSADVVTGSRDQAGNLRLTTFRVHVANGQTPSIEKIADTNTTEAVSEVVLTWYATSSGQRLATVVVTAAGNLKVIGWSMNSDGTFTQLAQQEAGAASGVACSAVLDNAIVTALREGNGNLELIYWQMPSSSSQTVVRKGTFHGGALGPFGAIAVRQRRGSHSPGDLGETIAAIRTATGNLKVIRWHVSTTILTTGQPPLSSS